MIVMEEFYVIKIVNKKVYLGASDNSNSFIWTKKKDSVWFDDQEKAERFANDYFKNFNNWEIVPLWFDTNKMVEIKIK